MVLKEVIKMIKIKSIQSKEIKEFGSWEEVARNLMSMFDFEEVR